MCGALLSDVVVPACLALQALAAGGRVVQQRQSYLPLCMANPTTGSNGGPGSNSGQHHFPLFRRVRVCCPLVCCGASALCLEAVQLLPPSVY